MQGQVNQGLQGNDNKKQQSGYIKSFELAESHKNQGLAKNFANPVQSGWGGWIRTNECRHQKPMPYRLATPQ